MPRALSVEQETLIYDHVTRLKTSPEEILQYVFQNDTSKVSLKTFSESFCPNLRMNIPKKPTKSFPGDIFKLLVVSFISFLGFS